MRTPSLTAATSSAVPLSVTECTVLVIASMKVDDPGIAENVTVVVLPKISEPLVRSRAMT